MTDNVNVKNGEYETDGKPCPIYCDFCDWLDSWRECWIVKRKIKFEKLYMQRSGKELRKRINFAIRDLQEIDFFLSTLPHVRVLIRTAIGLLKLVSNGIKKYERQTFQETKGLEEVTVRQEEPNFTTRSRGVRGGQSPA